MALTGCLCRCPISRLHNNSLNHTLTSLQGIKSWNRTKTVKVPGSLGRRNCWGESSNKLGKSADSNNLVHGNINVTGRFRKLLAPLGFTLLVGGCSYTGAVIWQYENLRTVAKKALHPDIHDYRNRIYGKAGNWRGQLNEWWNEKNTGERVAIGMISANVLVFLLWRIRAIHTLHVAMHQLFLSNPFQGARCTSMLLSTFSHKTIGHLIVNMLVLWNFTPVITSMLGKEHFMAFFCTAGVVSSLASYTLKVTRLSLMPSLGASGAILGLIGYFGVKHSDARLSVLFVDQLIPHSFSAGSAIIGIIAFDTAGVLLRWGMLDHAAHLGGILFGIWYAKYGQKLIWDNRAPVMELWHKFRGKP